MDEKVRKPEEKKDQTKLTWETPKLYTLDKGSTDGGTGIGTETFTSYPGS